MERLPLSRRLVGALAVQLLAIAVAAAADAPARFPVLEYRVLGNSVLGVKDVERAVMPYLGPDRSIKDVEAARSELEAAYHGAGYGTVFVDIPEQNVADGVVRLHVTEGRLHSTTVTGARYFSDRQILAAIPAAHEGLVPELPQLQKQVSQVNAQSADRSVQPVLKAGPLPGTVDLTLRVQDQLPFNGSIEFNNQRTTDTAPTRLLVNLSYGNMFGRLDTLSGQYETAPGKAGQVSVLAGNYAAHIGDDGTQLAMYILHSNSDIAALGALAVLGRGTVYGFRWIDPVTRETSLVQTVTLGADYKDYGQSVNTGQGAPLSTPVTYTNLYASYGESRQTPSRQLQWSIAANFGPRDLPNDDIEFGDKRYDAPANYFYVRADGTLTLVSVHKWQLRLQLDGQLAAEPLISNEEFSVGGVASVRGYLETEALGDNGVRSSLELQTPPWQASRHLLITPFVFADAARATIIDPLPSDIPASNLRSIGSGFDFSALQYLSGNLTWADPLTSVGHTIAHDPRWLFSVRGSW